MKGIPREIIKELIRSEEFKSTGDIMEAIRGMFADVLNEVLEAELENTLGYGKQERRGEAESGEKPRNYRNGDTSKTVKTQVGEIEIQVPRDRNGEFEPQIIGKYSRNAEGMEEKILALYAAGMSQRDIAEQIQNLYGVSISPELGRVRKHQKKGHEGEKCKKANPRLFSWMRSTTRCGTRGEL